MDSKKASYVPSLCDCDSCNALLSFTDIVIRGNKVSVKGLMEIFIGLAKEDIAPEEADFERVFQELRKVNDLDDSEIAEYMSAFKEKYAEII